MAKAKASGKKTAGRSSGKAVPLKSHVKVGAKIPAFSNPASGGGTVSLKDLKGSPFVLYFYPKDNTPGCTQEGQDFARLHGEFKKAKVTLLGVSRESVASHERFAAKYEFPFRLLADEDETLCRLFGVIQEKSLYGRKFMGVVRSTFVIDKNGVLLHEWRSVKVPGHADAVLEYVKSNL